jgi:hypothetical protein
MESILNNIKHEWKVYLLAIWMVCLTAMLINFNARVDFLARKVNQIDSTLGGIEGIVSGSDYTLGNLEKKVEVLKAAVDKLTRRVK